MTDGIHGARDHAASPWTSRIIYGGETGAAEPPAWLIRSYGEFRRNVTDPGFPCFFGTQAETRGEMFYSFVRARDLSHLPATMAKFAELSTALENQRNNFAVFFEPELQEFTHDEFRRQCWNVLQYLHDHDDHPVVMEQPDPTDAAWEFCFAGIQMFVVGCSPTYRRRRSRNIGPGIVMLFQPRSVFIDTVTKREIGGEARASVRRRLLAWDGVAVHPDLGVYGHADNREWKQYFLPDGDMPETGTCPFLSRRSRIPREIGASTERGAVGQLRRWATERPDQLAIRFLIDGESVEATLSYRKLDADATRMAATLRDHACAGDRVLLALPTGLDYVIAFYACLYADLVAVPAFAPEPSNAQHATRLTSILRDCGPALAVTDDAHIEALTTFDLGGCRVVTFAHQTTEGRSVSPCVPNDTQIAFLQYTSGSTAAPKGVMVSHGNLAANLDVLHDAWSLSDGDVMVTWLPLYHDMGLIGGVLAPLHYGFPVVLMSPAHFLGSPARWLRAVAKYRGTIGGAPDFAYQLCVDRVGDRQIDGIDLSSWRLAWCGAEPIRLNTMNAFAERFGAWGLPPTALYACYGLAEATLMVSGHKRQLGIEHHDFSADALATGVTAMETGGVPLVDCGEAPKEHEIRIVEPVTRTLCPDGHIGEIWFAGASVAQGYWQNPKASALSFGARLSNGSPGRYLRTGDLGFLRNGKLFICGRCKDLIIVRGQNLYPQDIELAVSRHVDDLRKGRVAAFPVTMKGVETIGLAAELPRNKLRDLNPNELCRRINQAVIASHQEPAGVVLLLAPGDLPRTSSGKLQRSACLPRWRDGTLATVWAYERDGGTASLRPPYVAPEGKDEQRLSRVWAELFPATLIGLHDNFFDLGGQSLLAARLAARVADAFDVVLPPRFVFEAPTIATQALLLPRLTESAGAPSASKPIKPGQGIGPLSFGQEQLHYLWHLYPLDAAYNVAISLRLTGRLEAPALRSALLGVMLRHQSLRTRFPLMDGSIRPSPVETLIPDWHDLDCSRLDPRVRGEHVSAHLRSFASTSFDLVSGPLVRAELIRMEDCEHVLALALHHIVSDGWSVGILLRELAAFYTAAVSGTDATLPALPIQYGDYALWQRERLTEAALSEHLAYWRERLGEEHPVLELPADRVRSGPRGTAGGHVVLSVPAAVTEGLRRLSRAQDATLFMTLLAAFDVLLHRYSGQSDIRIGVPVAGRPRVETEGLIGFFVNTLVIRVELDGSQRFAALLAQVRERVLEAQAHQDLPFGQLVAALQPDRSLGHTPLFQVLFNIQPAETEGPLAFPDLVATVEPIELDAAQFDLTMDAAETPTGLDLTLRYATDLFDASTIERLAAHYVELLEQLAGRRVSDVRVGDLRLSTTLPEAQLASYPFAPVLERIAAESVARGAAEAVSYENDRLSYDDLATWSNRIGRRLKRLGIGREARVGLCIERSVGLVAGVLGVLKAGGAYVPLDPAYPPERLADMIADSGVRVVVADRASAANLGDLLAGLDVVLVSEVADEAAEPFAKAVHPEQLAYVIYTSGSTGRPKGVGVTHRNLSRLLDATAPWYRFGSKDVWTLFHSYAFDFSVWELFGALVHGGRLVVVPHWTARDAEAFHALLLAERVTVLNQTPSAFLPLMQVDLAASQPLETLRMVIFGGEKLEPSVLALWLQARGERAPQAVNMYGITETTVHVSYRPLGLADMAAGGRSVIGVPIPDLSLRVLDGGMNPVPAGGIGEIHVGGAGLVRGYLNRPGLTAERFVPDPSVPGGRLYTSGDLARRLADGDIAYLGRNDQQVKIRGYRIELGEIEAALLAHPAVREATVIATVDGPDGHRLVAYVAGASGEVPTIDALRDDLANRLPAYMVPGAIMVLDALPLTINGKLDRAALPAPERVPATYVAPRSPIEATLCRIWEDVLKRAEIGITDNFFELGGDSILSLQVLARARQRGIRLTPRQLFENPRIDRVAALALSVETPTPRTAEVSGPLDLTPIQLWFFDRNPSGPSHWNQSVLLRVSGGLDVEVLEQCLQTLVARHDALRLRFERVSDGAWQQRVAPGESGRLLEIMALDGPWGDEHAAAATRLQRSLNLQTGPLLQAGYFPLGKDEGRLLLAVHHLAVDGVSWRILLEELQQAYAQAERGEGIELPAASTPWSQWTMLQAAYAQRPEVQGELGWWQAMLSGVAGDLPVEGEGDRSLGVSRELIWRLDWAATRRLLDAAPRAYRMGVDEVLLTALAHVLGAWAGRDAVLVELEGHGREDVLETADLSRTVGWFTTRFPIVLPCVADLGSSLKAVKERLRSVPAKGLHWGLLEYGPDAAIRAAVAALPRAQISFNYLGQFDQVLETDGRFGFAPEIGGEAVTAEGTMAHLLSLNGLIANGELELRWRYSPGVFAEATIEGLIAAFEGRLSDLVQHAATAERAPTPSDFNIPMDQGEFDDLLADIEGDAHGQ